MSPSARWRHRSYLAFSSPASLIGGLIGRFMLGALVDLAWDIHESSAKDDALTV